jgi:hypothetical protein
VGSVRQRQNLGSRRFYGSVSGNEWNSTSNYHPFAVREQFNNVQSLTNP